MTISFNQISAKQSPGQIDFLHTGYIESIIGLRSQPEGKRIMPETRFTESPALSVDPRVGISRLIFFLTYY